MFPGYFRGYATPLNMQSDINRIVSANQILWNNTNTQSRPTNEPGGGQDILALLGEVIRCNGGAAVSKMIVKKIEACS